MAGVFLSYARPDKPLAKQIVDGLRAQGIETVWDDDLLSRDWQKNLVTLIESLSAVIVVWTPQSKDSVSVGDEARLALKYNKLINVVCANLDEPPHPFDRINGIPLSGWVEGEPHHGWTRVIESVDHFVNSKENNSNLSYAANLRTRDANFIKRLRSNIAAREKSLVKARTANETRVKELIDARLAHEASLAEVAKVLNSGLSNKILEAAQRAGQDLVQSTETKVLSAESTASHSENEVIRCQESLATAISELARFEQRPIITDPDPKKPDRTDHETKITDPEPKVSDPNLTTGYVASMATGEVKKKVLGLNLRRIGAILPLTLILAMSFVLWRNFNAAHLAMPPIDKGETSVQVAPTQGTSIQTPSPPASVPMADPNKLAAALVGWWNQEKFKGACIGPNIHPMEIEFDGSRLSFVREPFKNEPPAIIVPTEQVDGWIFDPVTKREYKAASTGNIMYSRGSKSRSQKATKLIRCSESETVQLIAKLNGKATSDDQIRLGEAKSANDDAVNSLNLFISSKLPEERVNIALSQNSWRRSVTESCRSSARSAQNDVVAQADILECKTSKFNKRVEELAKLYSRNLQSN